ncbi:active regulator of SIRT1 [Gastrophryne carolinensis]
MSASLLRKGLELLSSGSSGVKRHPGNVNNTLASNKTGLKKQLKRLKRQGLPQKQKATAKGRVIKSAVEEYKKHASKNYLAQNLRYMLDSHCVANKDLVNKVLKQHSGRKARDQRKETMEKKVQETSVFSDSDFERFEKEYFGQR